MATSGKASGQLHEQFPLSAMSAGQDEEHRALGQLIGDRLVLGFEWEQTRRHEGDVVERHTTALECRRRSMELGFHIPFIISLASKIDSAESNSRSLKQQIRVL